MPKAIIRKTLNETRGHLLGRLQRIPNALACDVQIHADGKTWQPNGSDQPARRVVLPNT